jgi:hypothetical protein
MNIFYFYDSPSKSAVAQPDKMLVKMPLESAQMLCTAHRILDSNNIIKQPSKSGKTMVKHYQLPDEREDLFYPVCHVNHPCSKWVRESSGNYFWLYKHFIALGVEYKYRYGREHASITKLARALYQLPSSIPRTKMTPVAQAMPEEYKNEDPIIAYRNYCINEKHYAKWERNRSKPDWWTTQHKEVA